MFSGVGVGGGGGTTIIKGVQPFQGGKLLPFPKPKNKYVCPEYVQSQD